ncbi:unnamed protein product, partial [Phaeothamnion confervicola]
PIEIDEVADLAALRNVAPGLFARHGADIFSTGEWFETLYRHGFTPHGPLRILVAREKGKDAALAMPMVQNPSLATLSNYYSCLYAPLTRDMVPEPKLLAAMLVHLRRVRPRPATIRFSPLEPHGWFAPAL